MLICEMAAVSDCFSIGSIVACTTCFHKTIEGEVLAFDPLTKMLILKCPSSDQAVKLLNDVYIVNLSLCSDVRVIKECSTIPEPPQSLNLQRLSTRVRNAIDQKKRLVSALAAGVSPEGQKLYMAISKTINNEVTWNGANIVVFTDVTIAPPYQVENVGGNPDSRQLTYVRKLVEKFVRDQSASAAQAAQVAQVAAQAAASAAAAASSASAAAAVVVGPTAAASAVGAAANVATSATAATASNAAALPITGAVTSNSTSSSSAATAAGAGKSAATATAPSSAVVAAAVASTAAVAVAAATSAAAAAAAAAAAVHNSSSSGSSATAANVPATAAAVTAAAAPTVAAAAATSQSPVTVTAN